MLIYTAYHYETCNQYLDTNFQYIAHCCDMNFLSLSVTIQIFVHLIFFLSYLSTVLLLRYIILNIVSVHVNVTEITITPTAILINSQ